MFKQLKAPFDPSKISWRVGATTKDKSKGMALAYIDARDVMDRLDNVVGEGCWQSEYSHTHPAVCRIGIKVDGEWVWKSNGAGDTDVEAEKGALSDAFKRAGVLWGIGRYLYDIKSPWVALEAYGRSYKIKDSEKSKLINCLPRPSGKQQDAKGTDGDSNTTQQKELSPDRRKYHEIMDCLRASGDAEACAEIYNLNVNRISAFPEEAIQNIDALRTRFDKTFPGDS